MRFWLDKGVDEFRRNVANFYAHGRQVRDNPRLPESHTALEDREGVEYDRFSAKSQKIRFRIKITRESGGILLFVVMYCIQASIAVHQSH